MAVKDYNTNPDENTTISGINIAEGCAPSGINNAIRQLMADVKQNTDEQSEEFSKVMTGATESAAGTSGNVPAPQAGEQNKAFFGDGKYYDVVRSVGGSSPDADGNVDSPFLPLAGGNLTGAIYFNSKWGITHSVGDGNDGFLIWKPTDSGAFLWLFDEQSKNNTGGFFLSARTSKESYPKQLIGLPTGQLTWNNENVVRSLNGVGADVNGNINLGAGVIAPMGVIAPSNSTGSWIAAPSGLTADVNCSIHSCMYQQRVDDDDKIIVDSTREGNGWRVRGYTSQRNGDGAVIYFIVAWR